MNPSTAIALSQPAELVRISSDVAGLCKEIVIKTAMEFDGKKYVKVEGWQSIATAHGCLASSKDVERVEGGFRATGEIRRMSDGALLATAEGFVGEDEPTWFGGEREFYNKHTRQREKKTYPKRADYAIRAMAQTRAISRACRSAFAHVVVLMDAGLSTTPAEEVPQGGFNDDHHAEPKDEGRVTEDKVPGMYWKKKETDGWDGANEWLSTSYDGAKVGVKKVNNEWRVVVFGEAPVDGTAEVTDPEDAALSNEVSRAAQNPSDFRETRIHFGKNRGLMLSELTPFQRKWYCEEWLPKREQAGRETARDDFAWQADLALMHALKKWQAAAGASQEPRQATKPAPETSTQPGSWKDLKIHVAWPLKGHPLSDLDTPMLDQLRAKMEEKAKIGTRNLSAADRKLIAALAMELGDRKPVSDPDDEIPMFNGPEHRKLHDALVFAEISEADFMATAHDAKWIPADRTSFAEMSNETARGFVEDFDNLQDAVRIYLDKRNVSKA